MTIFTGFFFFFVLVARFKFAGLALSKRSVLQNPDRERTNLTSPAFFWDGDSGNDDGDADEDDVVDDDDDDEDDYDDVMIL